MKNWFRNFLKTFYSPSAIIETKYIKWYWNLLYVFAFVLVLVSVWVLFLWLNTWNMSNLIALGNSTPNYVISQDGVMSIKTRTENEEEVSKYTYMSELINVWFISDANDIKNLDQGFWGNQGLFIKEDIANNVDNVLTEKVKTFLGEETKVSLENTEYEYFNNEVKIEKENLEYNIAYQATMKFNYLNEFQNVDLNFTLYNEESQVKDINTSNLFVLNKSSMIFKVNNHNVYFDPIPYKESGLNDYDFSKKSDWKKMINFFMDITKYDWLPMVTTMFYLTIFGYLFVYIVLFSFIYWIITKVSKRTINYMQCCSIITYSMNCPALVALAVSMVLKFNILYGLLILSIGGLLFSFLVLFIYFRNRKTKDIKFVL